MASLEIFRHPTQTREKDIAGRNWGEEKIPPIYQSIPALECRTSCMHASCQLHRSLEHSCNASCYRLFNQSSQQLHSSIHSMSPRNPSTYVVEQAPLVDNSDPRKPIRTSVGSRHEDPYTLPLVCPAIPVSPYPILYGYTTTN